MGNILTKFKYWMTDAADWCINALDSMFCWWENAKKTIDDDASMMAGLFGVLAKLFGGKSSPDACKSDYKMECQGVSVKDPSYQKCHNWEVGLTVGTLFLGSVVVLMLLYFFFPGLVFISDAFQWAYEIASYFEPILAYFEYGFTEVYTLLQQLMKTMSESFGGKPILWWSLGAELFGLSILWVLMEFLGFYNGHFKGTPLDTVFHFVNTPMRWVRVSVLQQIFGDTLGNIISLIELPLEMMAFLISTPIGLVYWLFEKWDKSD